MRIWCQDARKAQQQTSAPLPAALTQPGSRAVGGNALFHPHAHGCCWYLLHGAVGVQEHILMVGSAAGGVDL